MLGFSSKLPVDDEERVWVDEGFGRLEKMLGRSRLLEAKVVLPNNEFFPDSYDRSEAAADTIFRRVCDYMQVDRGRITLEVFPDETEELHETSLWTISTDRKPAGMYFGHESKIEEDGTVVIALRSTLLKSRWYWSRP
jgi:hypothetical protein